MKNKKADIPVTILVIGVFAICLMALFSFLYVSAVKKNNFPGINMMESLNVDIEKFNFYNKEMEFSLVTIKNFADLSIAADSREDKIIFEKSIMKTDRHGFLWLQKREEPVVYIKHFLELKPQK